METAEVTDLYQASYYLMNGCQITAIDCIPTGADASCRISVSGRDLAGLTQAWFDRSAVVNLWAFRNAYTEIHSHVQQAKRNYNLSRRYSNKDALAGSNRPFGVSRETPVGQGLPPPKGGRP